MATDFFDCSGMLGKRRIMHPGSFYKTGEYTRKMEYYGIGRSLVCHSMAAGYDAAAGNEILSDEIKNYPELSATWAVKPHHMGDFFKPGELRAQMKLNNVKSVRVYPSGRNHNFSVSHYGELFGMLADCKVPVIADSEQVSFEVASGILSDFPGLRLIITKLHFGQGNHLYPIMEKHENLYLEVIGLKIYTGIEDVAKRFGAGRIVFGSSAPLYSGASAVGMVTYANISDDEKEMIAHGNLERLLGEVTL